MRKHRLATVLALAVAVLVAVPLSGCSKSKRTLLLPNLRPTIRLTNAPVDTTSLYFYAYKLNWIGYDPDGRVDHFEYAVDPPREVGRDTAWTRTPKNEQIVFFRATLPESIPDAQHPREPIGQDFHIFVIRAVDNQGLYSAPIARAFFSYTVAPTVQIEVPRPSPLISPIVTPAVRIRWSGTDPDGQFTQKPIKYKYKLFKLGSDYPFERWFREPDSLRRTFAPTFPGWDSTSAETTIVQFTNLIPNSEYLFVVVAFDEAGAYSPIFDQYSNMLRFYVGFAGTLGPRITMFNSFFAYTYPSGGYPTVRDPSYAARIQIPAGRPVSFFWFAEAPPGSDMKSYRWVMDLLNLDDQTPRSNERTDWYHWSQKSLSNVFATVGPFAGGTSSSPEYHDFYIEAEDLNGLVSLGWIRFQVVRPDTTRDLLIVDDTRLSPDNKVSRPPASSPDSVQAPGGYWPNAAELDTFLYARGNVRWRMTPNGWLSPVGVFRGYNYDTIGTRTGVGEVPTNTFSLEYLGHYKHIVWYVDGISSLYDPQEGYEGPTGQRFPITTLRWMSSPNRQSTLATWVSQGGQLWAMGGGFGNATNAPWNNKSNDYLVRVYSSFGTKPDLTPGRFMYDLPHWQSEWRVTGGLAKDIVRFDQPDPIGIPTAPGYWTGGQLPNPAYYGAPPVLRPKSAATDPMYPYFPNRGSNDAYGKPGFGQEFMPKENRITETYQVTPDSTYEVSTLDTLYLAYAGSSSMNQSDEGEGVNPTMTIYHGSDTPRPLIFTGFEIWRWARPDVVQLIDFVFQNMWGLPPRTTVAEAPSMRPAPVRPMAARRR
ncbi:MAG: hypothetical protein HZC42_13510 [Candidatus Eisenbacteria bacterium]|nr:hypothetical protein [Candidatus Eisenbacteria bacterium]